MTMSFCVQREVIVSFVDIRGTVSHHCLNLLFITFALVKNMVQV